MGEGIIDLDVMCPKEQIVVVAGKKIDTSMISFGIILELIDKIEDLGDIKDGGRKSTKKMMLLFGDVVNKILKEADSTIDDKWIKKHINGFMYMTLIDQVVTPLLDGVTDSTKVTKKKQNLI